MTCIKLTKAISFREWVEVQSFTDEDIVCTICNGKCEITEIVESSQGREHEITEECDKCEGTGYLSITDLKREEVDTILFSRYKRSVIEDLVKYSNVTGSPKFDLFCFNKHIFVLETNISFMRMIQ